ncbi:nitroreductase family protein [Pseudogemmobacter sonorensis]|uniref:nitroreductase family protein n=1 Tax=Pseudogemmobacter sonorensis TaxID=2989681 RepID=UPI00367940C9
MSAPDSPHLPADPATLAFLARRQSQAAKLFTDPTPGRAELERILAIALRTPDHGKLEPWRLIVLARPDFALLADLAQARADEIGADPETAEKGRGQFERARLAVAVIFSPKASTKTPEAEQFLSAGALCMNLLTAATAAGWGANWLSGWPSHDEIFRARAFGCTPAERVAGIVHIATPGNALPDRPRPDPARVVQWGLR